MSPTDRSAPPVPPFQRLVDDHGPVVWRYLCAAVGPADARDCYQETLLAALRAYPSLRHADNLRGWLLTIARHAVVDAWRVRRRAPTPVAMPAGAPPPSAVADPPALPRDDLWAAVADLPAGQRDAVLLRHVADLPYRDVAAVLGCTPEAARQRVRTALTTLRQELDDA